MKNKEGKEQSVCTASWGVLRLGQKLVVMTEGKGGTNHARKKKGKVRISVAGKCTALCKKRRT